MLLKDLKTVITKYVSIELSEIVNSHRFSNDYNYELVVPKATYAPWDQEEQFKQIYKTIKAFTLVDIYRCYDLWILVKQSSKLTKGGLIEVGVWRGGTGALIAKQAECCGIKEPIYLCDTFTGVVKAGKNDSFYKGGEHKNTAKEVVEELIYQNMGLKNVKILQGIFPEDTESLVEEQKFRFCHIDVDTYQSAKDVTEWIWDKMVVGSITVYDDYGFRTCAGVTKCVDEQRHLDDRIVMHNLNGHAVIIKTK